MYIIYIKKLKKFKYCSFDIMINFIYHINYIIYLAELLLNKSFKIYAFSK